MNQLSEERRSAVLDSIASGLSIRQTVRATGVAKGTIIRLLGTRQANSEPIALCLDCDVVANVSTANSKRIRIWKAEGRIIPDGFVVASSCASINCCSHIKLRRRIDTATARPLFEHAFPQILRLDIGETVGIAVPDDYDEEMFRLKLRSLLANNKKFMMSRWGVRLREDRVVIVMRLGTWASKKKTYERRPQVNLSPIRQPTYEESKNTRAICLGCGEYFTYAESPWCSRLCEDRYREIARVMSEMPI